MEEINNSDKLWGPVGPDDWKEVQFIKGEIANETDVKIGRAVFFIDSMGPDHQALEVVIPSLTYQIDPGTGEKTLAILIQAEKSGDNEVAGVRYFEGGNGICLLSELEFISSI